MPHLCPTPKAEGTHTPALFEEVVREMGCPFFPKGIFVDGTFGRGGHTKKILAALGPQAEVMLVMGNGCVFVFGTWWGWVLVG